MRIAFSGAQSTGKTTILDKLKETNLGFTYYTEVVRNLMAEYNLKFNEMADNTSQLIVYTRNIEQLLSNTNFISDRSLIDIWAYTSWLKSRNKIDNYIYDFIDKGVNTFISYYDILFYFPIEFSLMGDGVRSEDEGFRNSIDSYISYYLQHNYKGKCIYMKGSVENRLATIKNSLEEYKWKITKN